VRVSSTEQGTSNFLGRQGDYQAVISIPCHRSLSAARFASVELEADDDVGSCRADSRELEFEAELAARASAKDWLVDDVADDESEDDASVVVDAADPASRREAPLPERWWWPPGVRLAMLVAICCS
jgi:hypothetical protein